MMFAIGHLAALRLVLGSIGVHRQTVLRWRNKPHQVIH